MLRDVLRVRPKPAWFATLEANARTLESEALILGAVAFVAGMLVGLMGFWGRNLSIAGTGSVGEYVAIGSAAVAGLAFLLGRLVLRSPATRRSRTADGLAVDGARLRWFDIVALAVSFGVIALLGWIGVADLFARSFVGAPVYEFPAAMLTGAAFAVTAYTVFLTAARLTPMLLSAVLAVFLVAGTLASMLNSKDPLWWQKNLSALGVPGDISGLAFNFTLIIAGALVTIIARYGTATLPFRTPHEVGGRTAVRFGLVLLGVLLACVGVFPVGGFPLLHNIAAMGMTVVYAALVIALPRLVRVMPTVFLGLGFVFAAVVVLLGVLFAFGYYNLTAVELVAGALIFSWIILFLRSVGTLQPQSTSEAGPGEGTGAMRAHKESPT